jgi:hypothetical protein
LEVRIWGVQWDSNIDMLDLWPLMFYFVRVKACSWLLIVCWSCLKEWPYCHIPPVLAINYITTSLLPHCHVVAGPRSLTPCFWLSVNQCHEPLKLLTPNSTSIVFLISCKQNSINKRLPQSTLTLCGVVWESWAVSLPLADLELPSILGRLALLDAPPRTAAHLYGPSTAGSQVYQNFYESSSLIAYFGCFVSSIVPTLYFLVFSYFFMP